MSFKRVACLSGGDQRHIFNMNGQRCSKRKKEVFTGLKIMRGFPATIPEIHGILEESILNRLDCVGQGNPSSKGGRAKEGLDP